MADDLALKCSFLNLDEEKESILDLGDVDESETEEKDGKFDLLLVGRLVTTRSYNIEAFKRTAMLKVWAPSNNLIIRNLSPNLFAFQFFHWRDKEKVLNGRPWCWDNNLLLLTKINGDEQPDQVQINHSPFWVRLYNLPFHCRSDVVVRKLGGELGEVLEIEEDVLRLERYRRIRVMVDVRKQLRRHQWMKDRKGQEFKIEFKYERLPYFCFACGIIGHSERDCLSVTKEDKAKHLGWGLYLKASPRKGLAKGVEEVAQLKTRRQLFVTRDNDPADSGAQLMKDSGSGWIC